MQRRAVAAIAALLISSIGACNGTASTSARPGASSADAASTPAPIPPDIAALHEVSVDPSAGRSAMVDPRGGAITTTTRDGATVTLAIPPGAISDPVDIGVFPITNVATLPSSASLVAGVQFSPDGLTFAVPAILTIKLPKALDPDAGAVSWHADGDRVDLVPFELDGSTATVRIYHFSGAGLVVPPGVIAFVSQCTQDDYFCLTEWFEGRLARALSPFRAIEVRNILTNWYLDVIRPREDADFRDLSDMLVDPHPSGIDASTILNGMNWEYEAWRSNLIAARVRLGDSTFLAAEQAAGDRAAATILAAVYNVLNSACADTAASDPNRAVSWGDRAMSVNWAAAEWGLDTAANHLDLDDLLDHDCVQVVIDPGRTYTAPQPDSDGAVKVSVGYRIAGGDLQTGPYLIQVSTEITGSQHLFVANADEGGNYSQDIHWPAGMDPIRIDIRAVLMFGNPNSAVLSPSNLSRFDRITKSRTGGKLVFSALVVPGNLFQIYSVDADGSNLKQLTTGPADRYPTWSPDATKVAFVRLGKMWVMDADGSHAHELPVAPAAGPLDWSPDGSRIAVGGASIIIVNADGTGSFNTGAAGAGSTGISWSPDGTQVVFTQPAGAGRPPQLAIIDADGTGTASAIATPACSPAGAGWPDWSPDGSRIAFFCATHGKSCCPEVAAGPHWLALVEASGAGFTKVLEDEGAVYWSSWSPDGTRLAVADGGLTGIVIEPLDSSPATTVAAGMRVYNVDWSK